MADATDLTPVATVTDAAKRLVPKMARDRLARLVVVGSFLTIFLLVLALLIVSQAQAQPATDMAERAFTTILPVLAGWVGTVLAFYFSQANLETTTSALKDAIAKTAATTPVSIAETMIPLRSIKGLVDLAITKATDLKLADLQTKYKDLAITRLVFVEKDIFKYVMHEAALNAFLVKAGDAQATKTFKDLLDDADAAVQISKLVVFVKPSATLAETRDALGAVAGAQDIVVTTTGLAGGSMLGWLTNVDLTKSLAG
jgi:hypothetical protein